jgi:RNA polymerase sigma-70 factor (ECF subfamily)
MRNLTLTDIGGIDARVEETEVVLQMDEDAFRAFYERTAKSVWLYLTKITRDAQLADDLLQETYYRFVRADRPFDNDEHRKNYLFRIATNLVRDGHRRRHGTLTVRVPDEDTPGVLRTAGNAGDDAVRRVDLGRAMGQLKPRERELLWLAYANGSSHVEIADSLGVRKSSVKALLFRARRRLASLLRSDAGQAQS